MSASCAATPAGRPSVGSVSRASAMSRIPYLLGRAQLRLRAPDAKAMAYRGCDRAYIADPSTSSSGCTSVNVESRVSTPLSGAGDPWTVAGRTFTSRLIVGTGKYRDFEQN